MDDQEAEGTIPKYKRKGPHSHDIASQAETVKLHIMGHSQSEIARFQHVPENTVKSRLRRFRELIQTVQNLPEYIQRRAELIAAAECLALNLVVKKLPTGNLGDATRAFKELHAAGRLERNLSTANIESKVKTYSSVKLPKDSE